MKDSLLFVVYSLYAICMTTMLILAPMYFIMMNQLNPVWMWMFIPLWMVGMSVEFKRGKKDSKEQEKAP